MLFAADSHHDRDRKCAFVAFVVHKN
eukprot:SAG31_NODE_8325_length_1474_cov_1.757818_2_plen_25_part_01